MKDSMNKVENINNNFFDQVFLCPSCMHGKLSFENNTLVCHHCNSIFPVIDTIPRLVNLENYSNSFGFQWNIYRKTQLDSYSGLPISRDRLNTVTGWSEETFQNQRILEAGSGAGRFTEILVESKAKLFSFDFSTAIEANFKNNGHAANLTLFQGDIFYIPFMERTFDHVFCLGVLQHTPNPELAFSNLARQVKSGGYLYIDIYTRSWYHYLHWKYILRPITMRMDRIRLYNLLKKVVPILIPSARLLRKLFGRVGARLVPIVEFSHLGLNSTLNEEWSLLDTFDMYSPAHDHPQNMSTIQKWFSDEEFEDIKVCFGFNGVVGRGRKI